MNPPWIKRLISIRDEREEREKEKVVLIEGRRCLEEVSRHLPIHLLMSDQEKLLDFLPAQEKKLVSKQVIKKISNTMTPDGLVGLVPLPNPSSLEPFKWIVALDKVQDPGNVGTIIRTALGLGWEAVFSIEGTADLFQPKVTRASKGACFILPYQIGSLDDLLALKKPIFAADLKGCRPEKVDNGGILVLGNEGVGVTQKLLEKSKTYAIPMEDRIDSLNVGVAGGILMAILKGFS